MLQKKCGVVQGTFVLNKVNMCGGSAHVGEFGDEHCFVCEEWIREATTSESGIFTIL